jgi:hypothetical protein
MIRYVLAAAILSVPLAALAQTRSPVTSHGVHAAAIKQPLAGMPALPGQAAFATIQEVVSVLDANPNTDWSKVDINSLRRHLVDMNNLTLYAEVTAIPAESGVGFMVTGTGPVRESIRRMIKAHAETMSGTDGMTFSAEDHPEGAVMVITVENPADLPRLKGLGFFGIMTQGMHHQAHHLMIAAGRVPHH